MDTLESINQRIAGNLVRYRKAANLTQAELAQKINYSDKSVSKWESANGVPDIYILLKLAELYGVTVNDLVNEKTASAPLRKATVGQKVLIMLLSSGLVWLTATVLFVVLNLFLPDREWWLAFLYAVPANAVVITVLASVWKYKATGFTAVTVLIWSVLACIYTTSLVALKRFGVEHYKGLWLIFLLGVPLQIMEVLWGFLRRSVAKNRVVRKKEKTGDSVAADGEKKGKPGRAEKALKEEKTDKDRRDG